MKKYFSRKPYLITLIAFAIIFLLNLIIFSQTVNQPPTQQKDVVASVSDRIGDLVQIGTFIAIIAVIVWYAVSGKSREQLKEQMAGWKDTAERYRTENSELKTKEERGKSLNTELRKARRKDRDIIYKLVARLEGEKIEIEDLGDLWEEI